MKALRAYHALFAVRRETGETKECKGAQESAGRRKREVKLAADSEAMSELFEKKTTLVTESSSQISCPQTCVFYLLLSFKSVPRLP